MADLHPNDIWLRDTRAIWGKLFWSTERLRVIGEELVAQERTTIEINPEIQPALEETGERLSWEELKRQGLIGSSVHGGRTVQRGERKAKT